MAVRCYPRCPEFPQGPCCLQKLHCPPGRHLSPDVPHSNTHLRRRTPSGEKHPTVKPLLGTQLPSARTRRVRCPSQPNFHKTHQSNQDHRPDAGYVCILLATRYLVPSPVSHVRRQLQRLSQVVGYCDHVAPVARMRQSLYLCAPHERSKASHAEHVKGLWHEPLLILYIRQSQLCCNSSDRGWYIHADEQ